MLSAKKYKLLFVALAAIIFVSCTNIECPLGNVVQIKCRIYDIGGKEFTFDDTLTVKARGTEKILLNRAHGIKSFSVPLAYTSRTDTLLLHFSNDSNQSAVDSLFVIHESAPHFESVDCPVVFFHNINEVKSATDNKSTFPLIIDHVELTDPIVNYDSDENLRIYLRSVSD